MSEPPSAAGDFDPLAIVRVLDQHGVAYVLLGGVAARLHGSSLLTEDFDVTPRLDPDNLDRLARALAAMDARLAAPGAPGGLKIPLDARTFNSPVMTFTTRHGDIDVVRETLTQGGYEELQSRAVSFDVLGVQVVTADLDDIIADKAASGRPKDIGKLPQLRTLREVLRERDAGPDEQG